MLPLRRARIIIYYVLILTHIFGKLHLLSVSITDIEVTLKRQKPHLYCDFEIAFTVST
nr:MAG TPA: Knl1 RWD C-terminal domain [Caudoviricetes sp.]